MHKANYFFPTSHPKRGGFRVEHDPVVTAYIASNAGTSVQMPLNQGRGILLTIEVAAVIAVIIIAVILSRKKKT